MASHIDTSKHQTGFLLWCGKGDFYRPPTKLRECNVFNHICLFTGGEESRGDHYSWCIGPHCKGPPDIRHGTPRTLASLLVISGGHQWRPVQTCSFEEPPQLILTSGAQSLSDWQVGGTHPTGMLPCLFLELLSPANESYGEVMFLHLSVCPRGGVLGHMITTHPRTAHTHQTAHPLPPGQHPSVNKRPAGILLESFLLCFASSVFIAEFRGIYRGSRAKHYYK